MCSDTTKSVELRTNACKAATVIMNNQMKISILWSSNFKLNDEEKSSLKQCYIKNPTLDELDLIALSCDTALTILKAHILKGE